MQNAKCKRGTRVLSNYVFSSDIRDEIGNKVDVWDQTIKA